MKKIIYTILVLCLYAGSSVQVFAQDDDERRWKRRSHGSWHHIALDIGTNNYLLDGKFPDVNNEPFAVRPWGSWYLAIKSVTDTHLGGPFHLLYGADVSWYNFKFENENIIINRTDEGVEFVERTDGLDVRKSKFSSAYLDVSLVPVINFTRHRHHFSDGLKFGVGGYAGYRLLTYSRYVFKEDGDKRDVKDKNNFFMNNIRYGIRSVLGVGSANIFFNYDLNELFADNRGPELNAFSIGLTLHLD
ncbi:hypothetical protein QQ008_07035 [Fulvivirgaceae bacterium BMA10]|uniref:Outer membrane protein beta-barrel domain-containing protein n=1 Tax=Splendidivirga corallicola TaxID=3051826 RepID=A0ABT8KM50_9BACT|nr:hypothetical protein [Fulvivirgaceae bacterium BMA10]